MNTTTIGLLAGLLLALAASPLAAQPFYSQVGNEATAPSTTSTTPLYRSAATSS